MPKRTLLALAVAAVILTAIGTASAQSDQRFPDVPPDHETYTAIEWAAEAGITLGYEDGTFRPDEPLPKWAALAFVERLYDKVLQANEAETFTRGDMMQILYEIARPRQPAPSAGTLWDGTSIFDGKPASVQCGRGPATIRWDLSDREGPWLTVLGWNPDKRRIDVGVTGPKGATTNLHGFSHTVSGASAFSFGPEATRHIDTGETLISVVPYHTLDEDQAGLGDLYDPAPEATWGLVGFVGAQPGTLSWATTKRLQQWALTVDCG